MGRREVRNKYKSSSHTTIRATYRNTVPSNIKKTNKNSSWVGNLANRITIISKNATKEKMENWEAPESAFNNKLFVVSDSIPYTNRITYLHTKPSGNYMTNTMRQLQPVINNYYEQAINKLLRESMESLIKEYEEVENKLLKVYAEVYNVDATDPQDILDHINKNWLQQGQETGESASNLIFQQIQSIRKIILSSPRGRGGKVTADDFRNFLAASMGDQNSSVVQAAKEEAIQALNINSTYLEAHSTDLNSLLKVFMDYAPQTWAAIEDGTTIYRKTYLNSIEKLYKLGKGVFAEDWKTISRVKYEGTTSLGNLTEVAFCIAVIETMKDLIDGVEIETELLGFTFSADRYKKPKKDKDFFTAIDTKSDIAEIINSEIDKSGVGKTGASTRYYTADASAIVKFKDTDEKVRFNFDIKLNPSEYKTRTNKEARTFNANLDDLFEALSLQNIPIIDDFIYTIINQSFLNKTGWYRGNSANKMIWLLFALGMGDNPPAIYNAFGQPEQEFHASFVLLGDKLILFSQLLRKLVTNNGNYAPIKFKGVGNQAELSEQRQEITDMFSGTYFNTTRAAKYSDETFERFWGDSEMRSRTRAANETIRKKSLISYKFNVHMSYNK